MSNTLLTVIVPHRNTPEQLRRLLSTIPVDKQVKVVVVDDDSDLDRCANLLQNDFGHVSFLINPGPDHNAGSARNVAIEVVNSDWVIFADSDDFFCQHAFDHITDSITAAERDVDIIFFDVTSLNEKSGNVGKRHVVISKILNDCIENGSEIDVRYSWPGPVAKAIRFSLLSKESIRFDSVIASNDVIFSQLSGHYARRVKCVHRVIYCITESDNSLTANLTPARALARLEVLIRRNTNLMSWGVPVHYGLGYIYFWGSQPFKLNRNKIDVYKKYTSYLFKKLRFKILNF